jgi:hypothetical protein
MATPETLRCPAGHSVPLYFHRVKPLRRNKGIVS